MQELEKILEEMKEIKDGNRKEKLYAKYPPHREDQKVLNAYSQGYEDGTDNFYNAVVEIIRKHMNDGWIPVEKELPPNAKHKGALCPSYQLNTKYGVTEGWYNPDLESWFVLVWFQTERYLESEIDFENGAHPKIVRCENEVNEKHRIVLAWRPLSEPYRPEPTTQRPEWKDRMLHTFLGGHHD